MFRLDMKSYEEPQIPKKGIVMFMSERCSHCQAQVKDFKKCLTKLPVTLFLEGKDEERLRQELKKNPLPYPVYWTTEKMKGQFKMGKVTPTSYLLKESKIQKIEGRLECEKLKPLADKFFL